MAIALSTVKFSDILTILGRTGDMKLSYLYGFAANVPTQGIIAIGDVRGKSKLVVLITGLPQDSAFKIDSSTSSSNFVNASSTFPVFDTIARTITFPLPKSGKYLDIGNKSLPLLSSGISFVIKLMPLAGTASYNERIIDTGSEGSNYLTLLYTSSNRMRFLVRNSAGTSLCDFSSSQSVVVSQYNIVVARITGGKASVWINGSKTEVSIAPTDRSVSFRIGIDPYQSVSSQFQCVLKQMAVFNRGLTDAEITSLA